MRKEDGLHSSGHAYREERSEVLRMLTPEHFLPVHGEYAFLKEHEALARECGVKHTTAGGRRCRHRLVRLFARSVLVDISPTMDLP